MATPEEIIEAGKVLDKAKTPEIVNRIFFAQGEVWGYDSKTSEFKPIEADNV